MSRRRAAPTTGTAAGAARERRRGGAAGSATGRRRHGRAAPPRAPAGVLADLQPQPVVLDFEFRELVLAHEVEDLLQLVEVHGCRDQSSSQVGRDVREHLDARPASPARRPRSARRPIRAGTHRARSVKTIPGVDRLVPDRVVDARTPPGRCAGLRALRCPGRGPCRGRTRRPAPGRQRVARRARRWRNATGRAAPPRWPDRALPGPPRRLAGPGARPGRPKPSGSGPRSMSRRRRRSPAPPGRLRQTFARRGARAAAPRWARRPQSYQTRAARIPPDAGASRWRARPRARVRPAADLFEHAGRDARQPPCRLAQRVELVRVLADPRPLDEPLGRHELGAAPHVPRARASATDGGRP